MNEQQAEQQRAESDSVASSSFSHEARSAQAVEAAREAVRRSADGEIETGSAVREAIASLERFAHDHPMAAAVISGLFGFLLGRATVRQFGSNHLPGKQTTEPPTDD